MSFLTGYNGTFEATNKNKSISFLKSNTDKDSYKQITIPPGAYKMGRLNKETRRIIFEEKRFTEADYPFTIKRSFSTIGYITQISSQGPIITFLIDDSIRNLLRYNSTTIYEEYNLSPNPVDILLFDNIFLETNLAQGLIFKVKRSGIIHNWTMTIDPGYKNVEKFAGGISWYMMDSNDFISSISSILKDENGNLVSFNGQSITFRLSIKEI